MKMATRKRPGDHGKRSRDDFGHKAKSGVEYFPGFHIVFSSMI